MGLETEARRGCRWPRSRCGLGPWSSDPRAGRSGHPLRTRTRPQEERLPETLAVLGPGERHRNLGADLLSPETSVSPGARVGPPGPLRTLPCPHAPVPASPSTGLSWGATRPGWWESQPAPSPAPGWLPYRAGCFENKVLVTVIVQCLLAVFYLLMTNVGPVAPLPLPRNLQLGVDSAQGSAGCCVILDRSPTPSGPRFPEPWSGSMRGVTFPQPCGESLGRDSVSVLSPALSSNLGPSPLPLWAQIPHRPHSEDPYDAQASGGFCLTAPSALSLRTARQQRASGMVRAQQCMPGV